jgi:cellulose synthase/poly-beta-1,6-N-acetylglucosamine synthase-like glycosyltransferase
MSSGWVLDVLVIGHQRNPLYAGHAHSIAIIPAYNEAASIGATLDSLYSQSRRPDHILVGDDLSTDDTAKIALAKGAVVISHSQRKGNKAFNQQAIIESAEFRSAIKGLDPAEVALVIIDADTIIAEDGLEKLVAALEDDPGVVSASGHIIPQETTSIWQKARLVEHHLSMNLHKDVQDQLTGNLVASGCFVALRLSSVLNHGGFDTRTITEDFGLTCEQHLRKEKVRFVRDAVCYTKEPPTFTVLMKQLDRWYCGFFQNLKIHRKGITTAKNPGFSMMIALFLLEGVFGLFTLPFSLWMIGYAFEHRFRGFTWMLGLADLPLLLIPIMYGAIRHRQALLTLRSIPYFYLMRFLTAFAWWKSLYAEWIMGQSLTEWNKGHI